MKKALIVGVVLILLIAGMNWLEKMAPDPFEKRDIDCLYKGAIVMEKDTFWDCISLKYKGEIIHTGYYEIQAHYKVGDVINGPCINN